MATTELDRVFQHLAGYNVRIIGSVLRDYASANDIDVLFDSEEDFKSAVRRFGVKYSGWDQFSRLPDGTEVAAHIRRANIKIPGVAKRVQLLHSNVPHPYAARRRDGTVENGHLHYDKSKPTRYAD